MLELAERLLPEKQCAVVVRILEIRVPWGQIPFRHETHQVTLGQILSLSLSLSLSSLWFTYLRVSLPTSQVCWEGNEGEMNHVYFPELCGNGKKKI